MLHDYLGISASFNPKLRLINSTPSNAPSFKYSPAVECKTSFNYRNLDKQGNYVVGCFFHTNYARNRFTQTPLVLEVCVGRKII